MKVWVNATKELKSIITECEWLVARLSAKGAINISFLARILLVNLAVLSIVLRIGQVNGTS